MGKPRLHGSSLTSERRLVVRPDRAEADDDAWVQWLPRLWAHHRRRLPTHRQYHALVHRLCALSRHRPRVASLTPPISVRSDE